MCNKVKIGKTNERKKTIAIKCGFYHSVAMTESGEVYVWGWNRCGQLGINSKENRVFEPQKVVNLNNIRIKQIECGTLCTFLLSNDGEVYACGDNRRGRLGIGYESYCEKKVKKVKINEKIKRIYVRYDYYWLRDLTSFALSETNKYYIWGNISENEKYCEPKLIDSNKQFASIEDAIYYYRNVTYETIECQKRSHNKVCCVI